MATASEASSGGERRLHPLSWLFVLLQQLKQFALPLLVLLFTGQGDSYELFPLIGIGALVLYSIAQYFTYRFRIDADAIVIRSGVFQRNVRHVPFMRIHNVALHQSLLHRLVGVAEVRLESAGGAKPEGQMRVLSLADAHALEAQIRAHARAAATTEGAATVSSERLLLAMSTAEVIRHGLISNRGMIVVAAGFGALAQTGSNLFGDLMRWLTRDLFGWLGNGQDSFSVAFGIFALLLCFVLVLRTLSVTLALLQYHGFTLSEDGARLVVQRGLLSRSRNSLPTRRIQTWSLREGLLHRWFSRRSLSVESAAPMAADGQSTPFRELAPIATPAKVDELVDHLLSPRQWPITEWRPLHARAWRRQFFWIIPMTALAALPAYLWLQWSGVLLATLMIPLGLLRARIWARHAAWAEQAGLIAMREGWLDKRWRFAEIGKLQSLRLQQSPFDRRHGMATIAMDTAGASPMNPPLRIRYLPQDVARQLYERLATEMDARE